MAQTPAQRRANAKFAKTEEKRMGKPESAIKKKDKAKSPISTTWLVLLAFAVFGGLAFEFLKLFPIVWEYLAAVMEQILAVFK